MTKEREDWSPRQPTRPKEDGTPIPVGALCQRGWRAILITGFLRDLMIRHFAEPLQIEDHDLRRYVWKDAEDTGILIESVHRWRGDVVEKRPAILVKRNAYQCQRLVWNDLVGTDEKRGRRTYQQMWVGSHTLFCLHGTGASVDMLATEVQRELSQFGPVFREEMGLHNFVVTEVGAISEVEEAKEHFTVPVTVGWNYTEKWDLKLESLVTRRIPFRYLNLD